MREKQEKRNGFLFGYFFILMIVILISIKPVEVLAAKPNLNKTKVTLFKGESITLTVTKKKEKVNWSSSKKSVASVSSSGKVTAKKAGTAQIRAKIGKQTLKCKVIVKNPTRSKRLKLAKKEAHNIVKQYITTDMNLKEKAFVLFRYLTENCRWQLDQSAAAYQKNYGNEAFAALIMKKAACSGYAKAYIMLCEAANVPVRHVNANSWTHQWNEVKVKGKWIKVDAYGGTFADTTGIRKSLRTSDEEQEQLVFHFTGER